MLPREPQHKTVGHIKRPHSLDDLAVVAAWLVLRKDDRGVERRCPHEPQQLLGVEPVEITGERTPRQPNTTQHERRAVARDPAGMIPAAGAPGAIADDVDVTIDPHDSGILRFPRSGFRDG